MVDSLSINLEDLIENIGIDKDTVLELLDIYCCEMNEEMQQVKRLLQSHEWSDMQRTIHNIKGVSANLYLQKMFVAAEMLDLKLKKNNYTNIENAIHNLLDTFDETLKSIQMISDNDQNSKDIGDDYEK